MKYQKDPGQYVVYSRVSKMILPCVKRANTQIQIHKYTNTRIEHMMKCQKVPICGIFLKRGLFKGIKNDIPICQTCKHIKHIHIHTKIIFPCVKHANTQIQIQKYTNTQIEHMTKCQKDPTCGIFLKRGLFKGIKNDIPMCQTRKYKKYNNTNTQIQHMTKCQKTQHVVYF